MGFTPFRNYGQVIRETTVVWARNIKGAVKWLKTADQGKRVEIGGPDVDHAVSMFLDDGTVGTLLNEDGLYTDYSVNALPREWITQLSAYTLTAADTLEAHGTTISLDLGTTRAITVFCQLDGYFKQTSSATDREARARVGISTDGGSTFTPSNTVRGDHLSTAGVSFMPFSRRFGIENVTPTGNVVVRAEFRADNTEVTFEAMYLTVFVVGDL